MDNLTYIVLVESMHKYGWIKRVIINLLFLVGINIQLKRVKECRYHKLIPELLDKIYVLSETLQHEVHNVPQAETYFCHIQLI